MKKKDILIGLFIAVTLAIFSFLASSAPDGLERVAEDKNFITKAANFLKAPIPDYLFPGIKDEKLAACIAGIVGVILIFILGYPLAKLLKTNKK